ncbi:unnamed protein product [Closterium sp. Naga37s-1]|nr:unnamed protein product [Closterium sp. Naga37s-1]
MLHKISVSLDTKYHNMSLKETLKYERECSAVEKIDLQEEIEKHDDTIATLTAEITRLTEALRVSDALRMPAALPSGNEQAPSESGSADSASTGAGAKKRDEKPPKPPQTVDEARYELNVVQLWREAKTSKEPGMGVKGLGPKSVSKLRLACALVALNLKPSAWDAVLIPDTWEEQMPKTVADMAKQTAPVLRPPLEHMRVRSLMML